MTRNAGKSLRNLGEVVWLRRRLSYLVIFRSSSLSLADRNKAIGVLESLQISLIMKEREAGLLILAICRVKVEIMASGSLFAVLTV